MIGSSTFAEEEKDVVCGDDGGGVFFMPICTSLINCLIKLFLLFRFIFNRYFSVTRPLTYRARRTPRRAGIMIAAAWIISLVMWPPWIYAWPYIEGIRTVPEGKKEKKH